MIEKKKDDRLKNIIFIRDGVYEIQISNGTREDGKRDRVTETFYGNEDGAIQRRDKIKEELKQKREKGIKTANDGYTFLEISKLFINDKNYSKKVGTTLRGYKMHLNNYILSEIGFKKIRNITSDDLSNLYEKMRYQKAKNSDNNLSGTTIRHTHALIKAIFNYAIRKKWIFYNPAEYVESTPKFDTKEREYYDHNEIEHVLECLNKMPTHINGVADDIVKIKNLRFKTAITILFNSGLRREELFGLKWKDIKWNSRIFEVRRAVVTADYKDFDKDDIVEYINAQIICKKLKNESSRRNITMPLVCFDYLLEYRKIQVERGFNATDDDYIFQNIRTDGVWNPNYITAEWSKFIKQFSLKKITIHDIRHSHATDLLSMGVPIQDVSKRLGHSDVSTTLKIYTHSNMEQDKLIAKKLEEKYGNNYVSEKLNFEIIASIVTGKSYAKEEDINNAIKYITGESVEDDTKYSLLLKCRKYLFENYKYLESINLFLKDDIQEENEIAFINLINNIINISNIRPINSY